MDSITIIIAVIVALIITAITFYNTIITKRWRNKIEGEKDAWVFWIFYYNPDDKRIFLPKRTGLGFTLNFARPTAIILFSGLLFIIVYMLLSRG